MSVSLRLHPLQPRDNQLIKDCVIEVLKSSGKHDHSLNSNKKIPPLTIYDIDALSKRLAFRDEAGRKQGSLMDELFDACDLGKPYLEDLKLPDLSSNSDSTSDSDTDAGSMSSSSTSSIIRDDFVSFARSLRHRQQPAPTRIST
ncbi:hypothetical protein K493DRAFT_314976 [Basidiobolus meristosporus CBS 931.73]|uniref:Uncharacterized protein n=1 Tax=Basidiobolus meristosporus CBS 931.73 TaxID=1314790 RepID=A0A1Y1YC06_9FUNG|nr:hypothetical protein K493DRAFT_314976 [Basidiobolus meristosporus CBS 931.73]|eukprot:ORX95492.1 hypothetical protein K493DRAFT_314976 [Basidiobolus meristosporus CBS 931.73]